jgi:uncharacterized protein (TIGR00369 family)
MAVPNSAQEAIRSENVEALRQAVEAAPLGRALEIEFREVQPGRASATLKAGSLLQNFLGYAHTGAIFTLAEQVMAAAANSLGYVGLPLNCDIHFLKGASPEADLEAEAHVVDTQGRIARVVAEVSQGDVQIATLTEMVFLRSGTKT